MPAWKEKHGKWRRWLRGALLAALLLALVAVLLEKNLSQAVLDMAYAEAYSAAVETINRAVSEVMRDEVTYGELMEMRCDAAGNVTMLAAKTLRMNELSTQTALTAQQMLEASKNETVLVPLGSLFGMPLLAGAGPRIEVRVIPIGSVAAQFVTEFESAGINQTRHKISLVLSTTVRLIAPSSSQRVEVASKVLVAETIIVGQVPQSYVDVADQDDMLNLIP